APAAWRRTGPRRGPAPARRRDHAGRSRGRHRRTGAAPMMLDMPLLMALTVAFAVFLYVVMDGFDLGLAILFPLARKQDRDTMINSIAPVWDGNETWLVLGGGAVLAGFPQAY